MPVQVDPCWQIVEDSEKRLRLRRVMRTKNFTKVGSLATPQLMCMRSVIDLSTLAAVSSLPLPDASWRVVAQV
jgi:hypothetical protein